MVILNLRSLRSDLGSIFSDGNLDSSHASFTTDHTCNEFCELFGLETFQDLTVDCTDLEKEDGEISKIPSHE